MAGEFYETWAGADNQFYKLWPKVDDFVASRWGLFLAAARTTMAVMLRSPIDDAQKALIQEALEQDNPLATHRTANTRPI